MNREKLNKELENRNKNQKIADEYNTEIKNTQEVPLRWYGEINHHTGRQSDGNH